MSSIVQETPPLDELLAKDGDLDPEMAAQVHTFAITDVFTHDGPRVRRQERARCAQFARLGVGLKQPSLFAQTTGQKGVAKDAVLHPLAYFCNFTWPEEDLEALHDLFDAYLQAGPFDINAPFLFKTQYGYIARGDSVLEYAITNGKTELVTAALRNGARLDAVPADYASCGLAPTDLLGLAALNHGADSAFYRHLAAEMMQREIACVAFPSGLSVNLPGSGLRPRRRAV